MAHDKRHSVVYDLKVTYFDAAEQALHAEDPVCATSRELIKERRLTDDLGIAQSL